MKPPDLGCLLLAALFVGAGAMHFIIPGAYVRIVPPFFPAPGVVVAASGVAEILGGIGVLIPVTRRAAAWGLVALLVCVFPANIYVAAAHIPFMGIAGQSWLQWLRLPLQVPLIFWAWRYTRRRPEQEGGTPRGAR